jgi:uncharacterized phage protein (TIGR02220 family)
MNPLIIELDEITSNLTPGELLTLKSIYTGNKKAFERLSNEYGSYIPNVLESLQNKLYVKIQGEEFEELICREKTNILFKGNKIDQQVDEVLNYLNRKLDKKRGFSLTSKGNRKFISARLREGYTNDDMFKVINTMCSKWKGTNMEEYLRPETLFNETKFSGYLVLSESSEDNNSDWTIDRA